MLNEKKSKRGTVIALLCALALLALVVLLENTMKPTGMLFTVLKKGAVYALVAVSMNLLNGFTGLFSLGQAGFMLLGAYTYAILTIPTTDREAVYYLYNGSAVNFSLPELFGGGAVGLVLGVLLALFLGTRLGLSIRATGDNPDMVRASSLDPTFTVTVGLCLSNALTALSGAMVGQYQKTVDINSGTGIVVIGLACLIIGETVLGRRTVYKGILAALVGSVVYRFIYAVVFYTKVVPVECLKLLTAVIVALAIAAPGLRRWAAFQKQKHSRKEAA